MGSNGVAARRGRVATRPGRQTGNTSLHEQQVGREAAPRRLAELQGGVERVARQVDRLGRRRDVHGDVRVAGVEAAEPRHQPADREGRRDRDVELDRARAAGQRAAHQIEPVERVAELRLEPASRRRQPPHAAVGVEQAHAERLFQIADLMADRRRRDAQLLGGARQGAEAGRRLEGAQRVERGQAARHGCSFSPIDAENWSIDRQPVAASIAASRRGAIGLLRKIPQPPGEGSGTCS